MIVWRNESLDHKAYLSTDFPRGPNKNNGSIGRGGSSGVRVVGKALGPDGGTEIRFRVNQKRPSIRDDLMVAQNSNSRPQFNFEYETRDVITHRKDNEVQFTSQVETLGNGKKTINRKGCEFRIYSPVNSKRKDYSFNSRGMHRRNFQLGEIDKNSLAPPRTNNLTYNSNEHALTTDFKKLTPNMLGKLDFQDISKMFRVPSNTIESMKEVEKKNKALHRAENPQIKINSTSNDKYDDDAMSRNYQPILDDLLSQTTENYGKEDYHLNPERSFSPGFTNSQNSNARSFSKRDTNGFSFKLRSTQISTERSEMPRVLFSPTKSHKPAIDDETLVIQRQKEEVSSVRLFRNHQDNFKEIHLRKTKKNRENDQIEIYPSANSHYQDFSRNLRLQKEEKLTQKLIEVRKKSKIIWNIDENKSGILKDISSELRLGFKMGEGSFGIVYEGYDKYLEKSVAIKVFERSKLLKSPHRMELLEKEVSVGLGLKNHINICEFYRVVQDTKRVRSQ